MLIHKNAFTWQDLTINLLSNWAFRGGEIGHKGFESTMAFIAIRENVQKAETL